MGGEQSRISTKPQEPPKQKKPRTKRRPKIVDYLPDVKRKRPKSAHSWTEVQMVTLLGKQGRSATFDTLPSQSTVDQNRKIPRWQSKWEIDMRPNESLGENCSPLKTWQSMPLPTSDGSMTSHVTPVAPRSNTKKGKGREKRAELGRNGLSPLPDVDETDIFERMSVSSLQVDQYKMIYSTDARANNYMDLTARLWHFGLKKANKLWFMGQDQQLKQDETVPKPSKPKPNVKTGSRLRGPHKKTSQSKVTNILKVRPGNDTLINQKTLS